jgi:hypothetical protein
VTAPPRTFEFDWRPGEHARVTSLLLRDQMSRGVWRPIRWALVAFLTFAGVVAVGSAVSGDLVSALQLAVLVAIVAVLASRLPEITGRLQAWRVGRNDPNVAHPLVHTLGPTGLHIGMRTLDADLKWSGVYMVRETRDMFLFYYSKNMAYYLPKRIIVPEGAAVELSEWLRDRLPPEVPYVESG